MRLCSLAIHVNRTLIWRTRDRRAFDGTVHKDARRPFGYEVPINSTWVQRAIDGMYWRKWQNTEFHLINYECVWSCNKKRKHFYCVRRGNCERVLTWHLISMEIIGWFPCKITVGCWLVFSMLDGFQVFFVFYCWRQITACNQIPFHHVYIVLFPRFRSNILSKIVYVFIFKKYLYLQNIFIFKKSITNVTDGIRIPVAKWSLATSRKRISSALKFIKSNYSARHKKMARII